MKLYSVTIWEKDGGHLSELAGIYSSREQAQIAIDELKLVLIISNPVEIDEFELDGEPKLPFHFVLSV